MRMRSALCAMALVSACVPVSAPPAETDSESAGSSVTQAGVYVFDSEPGALVACIMLLDDNVVEAAPGFHNVWLGPGCESSFGVIAILSGWEEMPDGGVRLIGAEGSTFGEFTRGEDGLLRSVSENDGVTYTLHLGE